MTSIPVCICCHDDDAHPAVTIKSFERAGPVTAFVSRLAWDGSPGEWERCERAAGSVGAELIIGDWTSETIHRVAVLEEMKRRGHSHILIPDGDEICEPETR